jgi:hypothetical protein
MDIITTKRAAKELLPVCLLAVASNCAPSLQSHITTVRAVSRAEQLPSMQEGQVEPTTTAHARRLLDRPVDADAAVRIALLNNRELRAQLRELGVPASDLVTAGRSRTPRWSSSFSPSETVAMS